MATATPSADAARATARRQLRRVLLILAGLDTSVLVVVIGLAVAWARLHFPTSYLLALVLGTVSAILLARVALGVRLKRRTGEL
jgi:NhaP-type Na+/H+ or K+/H+ antiporter